MLKLDFLNVGDGDASLVRDDAADFVMLVDTGRPLRCDTSPTVKRRDVSIRFMADSIAQVMLRF